jgi:hypothetical protein
MFSTIVSGEADLADVFFLIAVIVAGGGLGIQIAERAVSITQACLLLAVGFAAAGLLVL